MINYYKYIFAGFFLLASSCNYELEQIEQPNDLIPKDSFTNILKDMMVLEAYVKTQKNNVHDFHKAIPASADSIFDSHGIDSSRYISSMKYYSEKQEILMEVYSEIQDEVILESANLQESK